MDAFSTGAFNSNYPHHSLKHSNQPNFTCSFAFPQSNNEIQANLRLPRKKRIANASLNQRCRRRKTIRHLSGSFLFTGAFILLISSLQILLQWRERTPIARKDVFYCIDINNCTGSLQHHIMNEYTFISLSIQRGRRKSSHHFDYLVFYFVQMHIN